MISVERISNYLNGLIVLAPQNGVCLINIAVFPGQCPKKCVFTEEEGVIKQKLL